MQFTLAPNLSIQTAVIVLENVCVTKDQTAYQNLEQLAANYRTKFPSTNISDIPGVQVARKFFRAIGLEPTRRRPSSEALLQRALKNKPLYMVNNLVDLGNWCSLDFLLPIGVYDLDKLSPPVTLRKGTTDEAYMALNQREINFNDRYVLVDQQGSFGSPMTDSLRSAISLKTTRTMLILYATKEYDSAQFKQQATEFADRTIQVCGGTLLHLNIYS